MCNQVRFSVHFLVYNSHQMKENGSALGVCATSKIVISAMQRERGHVNQGLEIRAGYANKGSLSSSDQS